MEKVFDIHGHFTFDIRMPEMVERFKMVFAETETEKYGFLSLPHHTHDGKLLVNKDQNVKGLFLKYAFAPNAYAFAGLVHPQTEMSEAERAENYYKQAVEYRSAGYDGIKMLEGAPDIRRVMGIPLDSPVYDRFYGYLEEVGMPIIMHVADPAYNWDWEAASEYNRTHGRVYVGDFLSKQQLTDEMFGILEKYPKLKLGLAHFGFLSYDITEAERFFSYENTFLDVTPGGSQLINIAKDWKNWGAFFEKHQNRILYGTDFGLSKQPNISDWKKSATNRPNLVKRIFGTTEEGVYANEAFRGVGMKKEMLDKLYRDNCTSLLGEPKLIDFEYLKNEIVRLSKDLPVGDRYYTKGNIIDITNAKNLKRVIKNYTSDLEYMLDTLNDSQ